VKVLPARPPTFARLRISPSTRMNAGPSFQETPTSWAGKFGSGAAEGGVPGAAGGDGCSRRRRDHDPHHCIRDVAGLALLEASGSSDSDAKSTVRPRSQNSIGRDHDSRDQAPIRAGEKATPFLAITSSRIRSASLGRFTSLAVAIPNLSIAGSKL
jgi:hypothetical protein